MTLRAVPRPLLCLGLSFALLGGACATREVRDTIWDRDGVRVVAREQEKMFSVVERGFQHPVTISPMRLENILGAIDVRGREGEFVGLRAAFAPEMVPPTALALSNALRKANPNQELAVVVTTKVMQHGIFNRKYLTSFVAWVQDDLLHLYFSQVDWKIPARERKTDLPEPRVGDRKQSFKVEPVTAMYQEGVYGLSVEWRDPVFRKPLRVASKEGDRGERTVLMEEELPQRTREAIPDDVLSRLTPAQLRQLADLEEARQEGRITEGRYRKIRKELLEHAGEDSDTPD